MPRVDGIREPIIIGTFFVDRGICEMEGIQLQVVCVDGWWGELKTRFRICEKIERERKNGARNVGC
jgi:hypothetical protein